MIYINVWTNNYHVITPLNKEAAHKIYRGFNSIKAAWLLLDRLNVKIEDRSISSLFTQEDIKSFYKYYNKVQGNKQIELLPDQQIMF